MKSDKIRVAVLFGGRSAEHEVSLRSAANVIQFLDPTLFEVIPIGIDKQGNWFLGNDIFTKSLAQNNVHRLQDQHKAWFKPAWVGQSIKKEEIQDVTPYHSSSGRRHFDVVFPVVHGVLCEDGSLQGLLEQADLPYVGCGVLSSAIGMDKDVSKRLVKNANINTPPYVVIKQEQWQNHRNMLLAKLQENIALPYFVKPANTGSSIGINKVKKTDELESAIIDAFRFDTKILIEKALNVVELEVAALESLDDAAPIISVVGEIRPRHEFYSYDAKYMDADGAAFFIPAPISHDKQEEAKQIAEKIFVTLECEGMARV